MTSVGVLDYGSGNLHSVCRAVVAGGATVVASGDAATLNRCDALVVPGVGAFAACMAGLRAGDGAKLVDDWVSRARPLLGICVGHQVMFEGGVEHAASVAGLGIMPGVVEQLPLARAPHMGWDTVEVPPASVMFAGLEHQLFYFAHSFGVRTPLPQAQLAWCGDGPARFIAAVQWGKIWTTQFHPEKSGAAGARLLANWLGAVDSS